jgi:Holliday junction resolvase RusA-like endonuclease
MTLTFTVFGKAESQGSMSAFTPRGLRYPIVTDSNKNLKQWRALVAQAASDAISRLPAAERSMLLEGVQLTVAFYLPRPKSLAKRITAHTKAPDIDKCVRSICDALTRVVFRDDAQVCHLVATKRYVEHGQIPFVTICVEPSAGIAPLVRDQPLFASRL